MSGSEVAAVASSGRLRAVDFPREAEAVVELIETVNLFDKPGWFTTVERLVNEWGASPSFDPTRDLQAIEVDGRLVGLARHSWRDRPAVVNHRLELWVHPDHRRRGLGSRLLGWAEDRARAAVAEGRGGPRDKPHQSAGMAPEHVLPAAPFAAARGYEPYRYHFEMRRPLSEPVAGAALPAGLELRPVAPEHHRAIWEADEEAFRDHWDHAEPVEGDFERFFAEPELDTTLWQVAWDGDEVAGLVLNTIYEHENRLEGIELGWLDSVATRRPWRGRGLAAALITRSLNALRERGMQAAGLGVDAENPTGALGLYERLGFQRHATWVFYRKPFDV